jgi:alpha/beta superfamily hydrolase
LNSQTQISLIDGPVGKIEIAIDMPSTDAGSPGASGTASPRASLRATPRGLALVAHPHPLFGGTMDNKVAQTLARTFVQLGYVAVRSNFRGVGRTEGVHDEGRGEQDDLLAVLAYCRAQAQFESLPVVLAGFSFGTFVQSHVAVRLAEQGHPADRLVLVATATSRWQVADVPPDTIVIHGEVDDTVPLASVLDWARPQELPITVIPGGEHFFHGKLPLLKRVITDQWRV